MTNKAKLLRGTTAVTDFGEGYQEDGKVFLTTADGKITSVAPELLDQLLLSDGGFRLATPGQVAERRRKVEVEEYEKANPIMAPVAGLGEAVLRGGIGSVMSVARLPSAALGGEDPFDGATAGDVVAGLTGDAEGQRLRMEASPTLATIGELGGQLAVPGALFKLGKVALAGRAGAALAESGVAVEAAKDATVLQRLTQAAKVGAVEGGIQGATLEDAAAFRADRKVDGNAVLTGAGLGAMLGFGLGPAVELGSMAVGGTIRGLGRLGQRTVGTADDALRTATTTEAKALALGGKVADDTFSATALSDAAYGIGRLGRDIGYTSGLGDRARGLLVTTADIASFLVKKASRKGSKVAQTVDDFAVGRGAAQEYLKIQKALPQLEEASVAAARKLDDFENQAALDRQKIFTKYEEDFDWLPRYAEDGGKGALQGLERGRANLEAIKAKASLAESTQAAKVAQLEAQLETKLARAAENPSSKRHAAGVEGAKRRLAVEREKAKTIAAKQRIEVKKAQDEFSAAEKFLKEKKAEFGERLKQTTNRSDNEHRLWEANYAQTRERLSAESKKRYEQLQAAKAAMTDAEAKIQQAWKSGGNALGAARRVTSRVFDRMATSQVDRGLSRLRRGQLRVGAAILGDPGVDLANVEASGKAMLDESVRRATSGTGGAPMPTGVGDYEARAKMQFIQGNESPREAYFARQNDIAALAENPERMAFVIAEGSSGIGSVSKDAASQVQLTAARAVGFLYQSLGQARPSNPLLPREKQQPAPAAAISQAQRLWNATMFPGVLLDELSRWQLSDETLLASRAVYPELVSEIQVQLMEKLAQGWTPNYQQRLQLSGLMGVADPSIDPGFQSRLSGYAMEVSARQAQQMPRRMPGSTGAPSLAQQYRTVSQEVGAER